MNSRRMVVGNPVLAEDIENAKITHDDVVRDVIEGFKNRQLVKRQYLDYVVDSLERTGKYDDLIESLTSLVQDRTSATVDYAHDPEIEKSRISDLGITCSGDTVGWEEVFSRCLESVQGNEIINGVQWPFLPLLIFECMFVGERLNPALVGKTLEEAEKIFLEDFGRRYSCLIGKNVSFKPMDEDKRHNNRVMYSWADKHCPPLLDKGIPYEDTLESISPERLDKYLESVYGSEGGENRVAFKDGYEYFIDGDTLYKRYLSESEKVFVEVKTGVDLVEARKYVDEHESRLLQETREWWGGLSTFDRIHFKEQKGFTAERWDALSTEDKKALVETYKKKCV